MARKRYVVHAAPDLGRETPPPFRCEASSAVEAIGKLEQDLHVRQLPRHSLQVQARRLVCSDEPAAAPGARGVIRPAPFKVRYHPPEARSDEHAVGEDGARIRFEVDGRATGELREIPHSSYGSAWIVSSRDPRYRAPAIGQLEAYTLWEACRKVELAAAREKEEWLRAPDHGAAAPERARAAGAER